MDDAITELRGHHLGPIYDIVINAGADEAKITDEIRKFIDRAGAEGYPAGTVEQTESMLNQLFFNEKSRVRVIYGQDSICHSGCIQNIESQLFDERVPEKVRDRLAFSYARCCKMPFARIDMITLDLFGLKPETLYTREVILKAVNVLHARFGYEKWNDLIWRQLFGTERAKTLSPVE